MPIAAQVGGTRGFQAAAENESQKKMRRVMMDNARKLCMGEKRGICERDSIKLHTSVRYSPELNGVAEHTIGRARHATRLQNTCGRRYSIRRHMYTTGRQRGR
jgi:hypothetical protein